MPEPNRSVVAFNQLPPSFPTQAHAPAFWEALGRAVATFGFLEETLGKAIFAYTGMREIPEEQITAAYERKVEIDPGARAQRHVRQSHRHV